MSRVLLYTPERTHEGVDSKVNPESKNWESKHDYGEYIMQ